MVERSSPVTAALRETIDSVFRERGLWIDWKLRNAIAEKIASQSGTVAPAQAEREPTASELIAWFKGRPGISWDATIRDIERALSALSSTEGK